MIRRHLLAAFAIALAGTTATVALAADGAVSVYTAHKAEIIERLIPEFEKATGLKAEIVKAGSGDIINRVKAEAANPQADVIWSIGGSLLEANQDLLEPYGQYFWRAVVIRLTCTNGAPICALPVTSAGARSTWR